MHPALLNRAHYPTLNECIYLNQASLGLVGQPAVEAMHHFIDAIARHGNLHMSDADEVAFFSRLREQAARLFHCQPERVAIASGASELLGQLPFLMAVPAQRNIVLIASDFPAITRPWLRYADLHDCSLRFVEEDPNRDLTDSLIESINASTAVVAVSNVQFATGSCCDVLRLRAATDRVGAKLIVDVTQAAGAMPIDVDSWQADAVISSGYKWLGGHGGVALGVFSDELLQQSPPFPGWMGAPDPFDFDATRLLLAEDARRYTQSTMSYASMAGLSVALEQLLVLDIDAVAAHAEGLAQLLIAGIQESGWRPFRDLAEPSASPHIITLAHPHHDVRETVAQLRENNIICGARNGRIRISLAPYNNGDDIMAMVN